MTQIARGIGARVADLRKPRMSAQGLADRMQELGIGWTRDIAANFENGRRDNVTVDELLALAVILEVPPAALLVDFTQSDTPVTDKLRRPGVDVAAWLAGDEAWEQGWTPPAAWGRAALPLRLARRFHAARKAALWQIESRPQRESKASAERREQRLEVALRELVAVSGEMRAAGLHVPELDSVLVEEVDGRAIGDEEWESSDGQHQ